MNGAKKLRVLYVAYWGALEPLGQSLVVPAVQRLAEMGLDITLITFEKAGDLSNREAVGQLKAAFDQAGVHWNPLRYHKTPKWPATASWSEHSNSCGRVTSNRPTACSATPSPP